MLSVVNESACEGAAGNEDEAGVARVRVCCRLLAVSSAIPGYREEHPPGQRSPLCPHKPGRGHPGRLIRKTQDTQLNLKLR